MNLRAKIQILIERVKPYLAGLRDWPYWKFVVRATIILVALLCVVSLYAWCSAPSTVDVPKAVVIEKQAEEKHGEAQSGLAKADAIARQVGIVEGQRNAARARRDESVVKNRTAETRRRGVEEEYEKVRNNGVTVTGDDLDIRERKLLTDLRSIQQR